MTSIAPAYHSVSRVWKIRSLHLYTTFVADLERGWAMGPRPAAAASTTLPPDAPPTLRYTAYPIFYQQPIRYPNPVTGLPVKPVNVVEGRVPEALKAQDEK